jgi:16S rRNA pseudouridine516 synthase
MRLDKFISHAIGVSRVAARRYLKEGRISVNEQKIKKADTPLTDLDTVYLDSNALSIAGPRYLMLHKPAGYICANTDAEHPTVMDLLQHDNKKLSIAGRLDKDTTGLVLLSDDGQWVHRIISPRHECRKTYIVRLDNDVSDELIARFHDGIQLRHELKKTLPATVRRLSENSAEVTLVEGKYHQVKRMFAACGLHVLALHRSRIGNIRLDDRLQPGEYRVLSDAEISGVDA